MKTNTLSFKIILRILLLCLGLGFIIFTTYYLFTRSTIEQSTRNNAILTAEKSVVQIEEIIKPVEMIPDNISWMMENGSIHKDSIYPFLKNLVKHNPAIYASAIAFEPYSVFKDRKYYSPYAYRDGDEIKTTSLGSADYDYFIMDWYQIPATIREPYWTEPYFDEGGANALLSTYSAPFYTVKEGKRTFAGIITIDISLEWLTDIVNGVKIFQTGYAFLISRNGVFVTHPNRSFIMNETIFTLAKESNVPQLRDIGRSMIRGESNLSSIVTTDNERIWIYHTQLPSTKWSLGVVYPHNEMYASLHRLNINILLLSVLGLTILVLLTIGIINQLISPLSKFAKSAQIIAKGDFNADLPRIQTNDEMKELHDSFVFLQKELKNYITHLKETTSAKEKIESELRIAKEIQMGMIPHIFPPFPNLSQIDLYASLVSAKEVGGDLYDFFLSDSQNLCFAIGDVSGKGIPASLFMAVTRTLLRSVADNKKSASQIVSSINKTLSFNNESSMFVTFFLGILDINSGKLRYCNAGHNPPLLIKGRKEASFFNLTKSIPVGLFEEHTYTEESIILEPGDNIFLYTDGLTEAENINQHLFGEDRLLDIITQAASSSPKEIIDRVSHEVSLHVNGHEQSDDLTLMSIVYYGKREKG